MLRGPLWPHAHYSAQISHAGASHSYILSSLRRLQSSNTYWLTSFTTVPGLAHSPYCQSGRRCACGLSISKFVSIARRWWHTAPLIPVLQRQNQVVLFELSPACSTELVLGQTPSYEKPYLNKQTNKPTNLPVLCLPLSHIRCEIILLVSQLSLSFYVWSFINIELCLRLQ